MDETVHAEQEAVARSFDLARQNGNAYSSVNGNYFSQVGAATLVQSFGGSWWHWGNEYIKVSGTLTSTFSTCVKSARYSYCALEEIDAN